jgi:zinc transport system substrate-binding protein
VDFKKSMLIILVMILAVCPAAMTGCQEKTAVPTGKDGKLTIAVSIMPQKALIEAICADRIHVLTAIPPGYSPESYEPAPQEVQALAQAAIYFSIGVPAEKEKILPQVQGKKVVDLAAEVAAVYPDRVFAENERDPHIWLSPKRVKVMVEVIAREMIMLDPQNADQYLAGKNNYLAALDQLDKDIQSRFSGLARRSFFVFHPSFGYLADDYGLQMFSLEEHGKEATPQHLQAMIDLALADKVKTVFAQAEMDSRQLDAFADETGCTITILDPLSADYLTNMQAMTKAIAGALQDE